MVQKKRKETKSSGPRPIQQHPVEVRMMHLFYKLLKKGIRIIRHANNTIVIGIVGHLTAKTAKSAKFCMQRKTAKLF